MKHRVVVTGVGVISPLGNDINSFWNGLIKGKNGISPISSFDVSAQTVRIAGEVKVFDAEKYMDRKEAKRLARFTQFAIAAGKQAWEMAGIEDADPNRVGVYVGTGIGGLAVIEEQVATMLAKGPQRVSPFTIPSSIANMASGNLAIVLGAKGPNVCSVTACASGSHAIGDAFHLLTRGLADVMVCGGTEAAITPLSIAGFAAAKALSTRNDDPQKACRPFDATRDGFVMGEGSGVLVLETLEHAQARGAKILAEVVGYGLTADAHHITLPAPEGEGAGRAMKMALDDAEVAPEKIDYINAHGTSTPANDVFETMAIKALFGEHAKKLMVSSTKSMTGHLLGAAGAVEAIACVYALKEGIIPPTINYENPDPDCDLDYVPNQARKQEIEYAMSNNMGFGGHNASLVFKRFNG